MSRKIYTITIAAVVALIGAVAWSAAGGATKAKPAESGPSGGASGGERVTEPLRAEHRELLPHIDGLRKAGDAVGVESPEAQRDKVHESYEFLTKQLIPHAIAEDKVLYVEVDKLIGAKGDTKAADTKAADTKATDTMRRDHTEVGALTKELGTLAEQMHSGTLTAAQQQELRRVLYSLHGIVKLHFAKEEEVYLPLLDRELTPEAAQRMFERMEQVAGESGGDSHHHAD